MNGRILAASALAALMVACSRGGDAPGGAGTSSDATTSTTSTTSATAAPSAAATTTTSTSTSTTSPTTSTTSPTTTATSPTTSTLGGLAQLAREPLQAIEIGRSVEGRPLVAVQRGTPGGAVVLVIGVIHGDEDDGVAIVERLATAPVPDGVDLWLIESMNPDGQAVPQRWNANLVDLNRNFPYQWGVIGQPGDPQYAGTGPASEPETQAVVDFVSRIQPALGLWYHQDLYRLSPGEGFEGQLKERYSQLTGVPILPITGGTYTGIAATWQRNAVDGASFIVELGATLSAPEADRHAAAVLELAAMVAAA